MVRHFDGSLEELSSVRVNRLPLGSSRRRNTSCPSLKLQVVVAEKEEKAKEEKKEEEKERRRGRSCYVAPLTNDVKARELSHHLSWSKKAKSLLLGGRSFGSCHQLCLSFGYPSRKE